MLPASTGSRPTRSRRSSSTTPRTARSAISRCRSPSSWPAACGKRRAPSRRSSRRARPVPGVAAHRGARQRLPERLPRPARVPRRAPDRGADCPRPRRPRRAKRSSSTRPSIRTRPRTSATCATRRSATRSCACCGSAARRSKCRTTSTTPACRSPTSSSGSRELERKSLADVRQIADDDPVRLLLLGPLRPRHGMVRRRQGAARRARRDAARHRARRQRPRGARRVRRRRDRPLPSADDGADEHRLRPAHVGRRHPAAAVLGARVRDPQGAGRRVPADRGTAGGLLGDGDRRWRSDAVDVQASRRRGRADDGRARRGLAREGDRAIERHRHLRRARTSRTSSGSSACSAATSRYRPFATRADGVDAVGDDQRPARSGDAAAPAVRRRGHHLQRHRRAAVVPAEAAEAGARARWGTPREAERLDPLLVRDGGAVARHRARARLRARRPSDQKKPFVEVSGRKGLGVKADDLLDLLENKATQEVRATQPGSHGRRRRADRPRDRACGRPLFHDQVLPREGDCLRHRRGAQLRGRERTVSAVLRSSARTTSSRSCRSAKARAKPT